MEQELKKYLIMVRDKDSEVISFTYEMALSSKEAKHIVWNRIDPEYEEIVSVWQEMTNFE